MLGDGQDIFRQDTQLQDSPNSQDNGEDGGDAETINGDLPFRFLEIHVNDDAQIVINGNSAI